MPSGATLATLEAVTKEIYEGSLREQLNNEVKTLRRIEKTSEGTSNEVGGRWVTFPIHTTRNAGIGARDEYGVLPTPGHQGTAAARVRLKHFYGGARLSGQAIELIDTNYQSFIASLDLEIDGLRRDIAVDMNRQVYGNGSGVLGTLTAATSTAVVVTMAGGTRLFQRGMKVDVLDSGGTPVVTDRTVVSITATTVTLDGSNFSASIGDILVRHGNHNKEWTGFAALIGTGALFNINPANEPVWQSSIHHNGGSGRALSENLMIVLADEIRDAGGRTTVIFTTRGIRRAYFNLLKAERQFVNTKKFDGGFEGLGFFTDDGEIPLIVDKDAPRNRLWFVNEKAIKLYRHNDWSWMDRDGSKWSQVRDSNGEYDAYGARLYQYSELGTDRRNTHGILDDINEA